MNGLIQGVPSVSKRLDFSSNNSERTMFMTEFSLAIVLSFSMLSTLIQDLQRFCLILFQFCPFGRFIKVVSIF